MKKLLLLALLVTMMVGCDNSNNISTSDSLCYNTITIDSCEYIEGYNRLAHKGNCKYCVKRNKKMIKEQIDTALLEIFD